MVGHRYRLPLAVVAAIAAAGAATLLLRPRSGMIEAAAVPPTAYFSPEQLERAEDFNGPQRLIGLGGIALSGATLALLALRPPRSFQRFVARLERRPLAGSAAVGASIVVVLTLVTLPLGAVAHARAVDVGLSTQGAGAWLVDQAKSTGVAAVLAGATALIGVALIRRFPRGWWAPTGVTAVILSAALVYAAPVVLDPIFNRFVPLPDGTLRARVLELADRAGVGVGEVYRVDASRRTTGANAYVGGLGETKRVVLYDNLIEELPQDQVESVVAHELSHVTHRDVPRGLLWLAIVALPGMLVVQLLAERIEATGGSGRAGVTVARAGPPPGALTGAPAAVPALALSLALVTFAGQIAGNVLSRQVEARADAFALQLTREPAALVALQRSLAIQNVSDPDPPALLHDLFGTHPTTVERIGLGLEWARER